MTYTVSGETLNPTHSLTHSVIFDILFWIVIFTVSVTEYEYRYSLINGTRNSSWI